VTADDAFHIAQDSAWRLLLELVAGDGRASEHHPVESIIEIVGELGLQPAETERIGTLVSEAVRKAAQRGERDQHASRVSIRVWVVGARDGSSLDAWEVGREKRRGWGFYLLERQANNPQASAGKPHHLVELCLYQER
jgi:hypothetical protein